MKLSLVTLSSLCSLAVAQVPIFNLPPRAACAAQCNAIDVCCIAACHEVPCPSGQQADEIVRCVSGCSLGTGTPNDVVHYTNCRENCVLSHYFSATSASSTSTSSSSTSTSASTATTTSSDSSSSYHTSATETSDGTRTGSSASETSSGAATVNEVKMGASAAGLFSFILAAWAV